MPSILNSSCGWDPLSRQAAWRGSTSCEQVNLWVTEDKLTFSLQVIRELGLLWFSLNHFRRLLYQRNNIKILYIPLDYSIPVGINESSEHRWTLNFCSDIKITVGWAVNMILLFAVFPQINSICSVARGQFFSDVSVNIDCKLTSCALIFSFTPMFAAAVYKRENEQTNPLEYKNNLYCYCLFLGEFVGKCIQI